MRLAYFNRILTFLCSFSQKCFFFLTTLKNEPQNIVDVCNSSRNNTSSEPVNTYFSPFEVKSNVERNTRVEEKQHYLLFLQLVYPDLKVNPCMLCSTAPHNEVEREIQQPARIGAYEYYSAIASQFIQLHFICDVLFGCTCIIVDWSEI